MNSAGWDAFINTEAGDIMDRMVSAFGYFYEMLESKKSEAEEWGMDREASMYAQILESPQMKLLDQEVARAEEFMCVECPLECP